MAWLGSGVWGKRIEITVSNTNIGSDLTHFPLLLTLGTSVGTGADDVSAIFDELTSDANRLKIAVTDSSGDTEIKCEIEDWDDASESAHLWVAASGLTLSSSGTTTLFIYYDAGHADNTANVGDVASAAGEAVWDSDYVLVAHLSETTGTHLDSTSNDNDESAKSVTDQDVAGQIGGGDNFLEGHVQFTNTGMVTSAGTFQTWFQEDVDPSTRNDFIMSHRATGDTRVYARTNSGSLVTRYQAGSRTVGDIPAGWNHVAVSWSGANWWTNFNNNAQLADTAAGTIPAVDTHVQIASYIDLGTGQNLDGDIDELRLSSIQRSDDWLVADWHSATDNLVSYGAEELEPSGAEFITDGVAFNDIVAAHLEYNVAITDGVAFTDVIADVHTSPTVTVDSTTPSEFDFDNSSVNVDGSDLGSSQGSSVIYLSPNTTVAGAGEVNINDAVNTWADTQINLDFTQLTGATLTLLHTMGPGARNIIVDNLSTEDFVAVTLHRPAAFQMVLGDIEPGGTSSRLTGLTGSFGGGRAEETAAQNPSTTTVNVASNGNREEVWSMEAKLLSRVGQQYDLRILIGGLVVDTYTVTPQVTIEDSASTPRFTVLRQAVKRGSSW